MKRYAIWVLLLISSVPAYGEDLTITDTNADSVRLGCKVAVASVAQADCLALIDQIVALNHQLNADRMGSFGPETAGASFTRAQAYAMYLNNRREYDDLVHKLITTYHGVVPYARITPTYGSA